MIGAIFFDYKAHSAIFFATSGSPCLSGCVFLVPLDMVGHVECGIPWGWCRSSAFTSMDTFETYLILLNKVITSMALHPAMLAQH